MKKHSNATAYAEKWFSENGFEVQSKTELPQETEYVVKKDGIEDVVVLPHKVNDGPAYMALFHRAFNMYASLHSTATS